MLLQGLLVDVLVHERTLFQLSYNLHHRVKHDDAGGAFWVLGLVVLTDMRVLCVRGPTTFAVVAQHFLQAQICPWT